MANVKTRLNTKTASNRGKGRGRVKKALTGGSDAQNSVPKTKYKLNFMTSDGKAKINQASSETVIAPKGIITRSGRIKKKSKDNLKVMDNILKTELLIDDQRKGKQARMRNVNNNNIVLSDQNNLPTNGVKNLDSPKTPRTSPKSSPKAPRLSLKKPTNINSMIVKNLNFGSNGEEAQDQNKTTMDPTLRENVLNNMKSVLLNDDEFLPETTPKKYVRNRAKTSKGDSNKKGNAKRKLENDALEKADAKAAKMKQVTLSNGLVLTLSLVQCDYCQKSFSNKSSLGRHMLTHEDSRPHVCQHCPRKFRYISTLRVHQKRQHASLETAPEYHMCHICDKAFLMLENLNLHLASHVKSENNFKCLYCDKQFTHRLLLINHEKTHLVTGQFKCYLCEMTYHCRSRLSHHIKTHTKIKEYICQYCGKEFMRLNSIKRHVQVCHGGQRKQCPICLKYLKGHLSEHMRLHAQNRPHVCPDCGQRFTQATQLTVHKRMHSGVRPYNCRICQQPFSHTSALILHIRRHTGEKPHACALCPMAFSQIPHMKSHMRKIHGKDCAYKCTKCNEFFKLKTDLDMHVKTCTVGDKVLSFEEQIQASVQIEDVEVESNMSISKMRFLLALLLTMIASKEKLKYLGFNKRLIDDLLEESLEAMGQNPCKDRSLSPLKRLKCNIEILLEGTIPPHQMDRFRSENKSIEELLVLLTDEKKMEETFDAIFIRSRKKLQKA